VIWVIQPGFLGDVALSLPFLHRLAEQTTQDSERIVVFVRGPGKDLAQLALDRGLSHFASRFELRSLDRKEAGLGWMLKQAQDKPRMVFCLHRSFRSGLLAWLSGAPLRVGFSSGAAAFFYTHAVARSWSAERGREKSELEKNLDLLRALEWDSPPWDPVKAPSLLAPPPGRKAPEDRPVALALGSPWPTKRYPLEHWVVLVRRLLAEGTRLVLVGDPPTAALAEALVREVPSVLIDNRVGRTSIADWVDTLWGSRLLISGDSAGVHVAADLGVPVLALFGPTIPEFGFAPWRKGSRVLGVEGLDCRPCDIHGPRQCPKGHFRCMKDLAPNIVFDQVKRFDL
jgi:heptosyltransferase-2